MDNCLTLNLRYCLVILLMHLSPATLAANTDITTLSVCSEELFQETDARTLSSPLLDNQRAHLVVNSNTGDCPSIELAVPDTAVTWGRIINPTLAESPRARLILQGHFLPGAVSVSEIINPEPAPAPVASSTALIPPGRKAAFRKSGGIPVGLALAAGLVDEYARTIIQPGRSGKS